MKYFRLQNDRQYVGRAGFTLVELLLVMAIIGVLSSLALVVVNEAQYDARVSATRSRINMLDQIIRQRMDIIQEKRLPIDLGQFSRRLARSLKRRIIADMMDVEMPRSYWDIAYQPSPGEPGEITECTFPSRLWVKWIRQVPQFEISNTEANALISELSLKVPSNALRFRVPIGADDNYFGSPNNPPDQNPSVYPEGEPVNKIPFAFDRNNPESLNETNFEKLRTTSEYLYIILQTTQFNGISAIEAMGERAFGDSDNDGFREVINSWGNPIGFQFETYFDNGELFYEGYPNPNADPAIPADLVAGNLYQVNGEFVDEMLDVQNIRIRFVSTAGRSSANQRARELITN